jgi:gas vesicle protein
MKAFLVGLGLGALVGVAYAPRSGRETRRELEDRARQSVEGANERVDSMRERLSSARSRVTSAAREVKRGVQSMRQPGSSAGNEAQAGFGRRTENAAGRNERPSGRETRGGRTGNRPGPAEQWGADAVGAGGSSTPDLEMAIGGDAGGEASGDTETVVVATFLEIINEWPEERLIAIRGIGPVLASKIIKNRPYEQEEDLIGSKELPPSAIEALRKAS